MDAVLTPEYSRSWAADVVLDEVGGRTVDEAIRDGVETVMIWRAVCGVVEVPPLLR